MIKAFISMFNNFSNQIAAPLDCTSIPKVDYDNFRLTGFKPELPLTQIHNVRGPARVGPTPAENFERGIKKDKDQYPEYNDEKNWYNF
jgi:hypothetical protein